MDIFKGCLQKNKPGTAQSARLSKYAKEHYCEKFMKIILKKSIFNFEKKSFLRKKSQRRKRSLELANGFFQAEKIHESVGAFFDRMIIFSK